VPPEPSSQPDPAEGLDRADPVGDEVWLYRLIPVELCEPVEDGWEFRSGAFANSTEDGFENEMSIVVGDTLAHLQRSPEDLPQFSYPDEAAHWGVAKVKTEAVRTINEQEVVRSPEPNEPAHGDVLGNKNSKRRKKFKKLASWVIEPAASSESP
jgi:hypothetical protein